MMGVVLDALKQIDVKPLPAPVILPIGRGVAEAGPKGTQSPLPRASTPAAVPRYAFPAMFEPRESSPTFESPKIIWPECPDRDTMVACGETADGILRQLPLNAPTVLAFTSPCDGDGKTSLLLNLSPQLAKRIAGNCLVVDASHDKPDLTARLRVSGALSSDSRRNGDPDARSHSTPLIYPTNLDKLSVLPASPEGGGGRIATPAAIADFREGWSLVLLDMASLAHLEAATLARNCDGVYLVVRLGYTPRRAVREAGRVIRDSGGKLLGCVVVK